MGYDPAGMSTSGQCVPISGQMIDRVILLGPVNTIRANSDRTNFSGCAKRAATNTGCILAASDKAAGKIRPVPSGCRPDSVNRP